MLKKVFLFFVYGFAVFGVLLTGVFFAVQFGLTKESGIIDTQRGSFLSNQTEKTPSYEAPQWTRLEEWQTLQEAVLKDREIIYKASAVAGIPSRLLVAPLVVEQLRLFFDSRELFKTVFAPLKILGVQSQFSWGVMGIKQETAVAIEEHLKDSNSPFYLGPAYEHLLDFSTDNPDQERFARLTDQHNRYYSYLYGAIYIKELETQWQRAGFDISDKPEIISTLYNIGFDHSLPNASPQTGDAEIPVGDATYSFGALAADFYHSQELIEYFPN
ncbi:MAG: hypothetical protein WC887_01970 [Candidatus Paceibacterota bacterium]|jgi:hypothetical protein